MTTEHDISHSLSEDNEQVVQRKSKLAQRRRQGIAYPNDFIRDSLSGDLHAAYDALDEPSIAKQSKSVCIAGRLMARRLMGKASFIHVQDMQGRIQAYVTQEEVSPETYEAFKHWDLGDIIGVKGLLFKTKTGELSVKAQEIYLLTKALRPLPDKYHGLQDHEQRFRQRYLDLMVNPESRRIFEVRSKIISALRAFLDDSGFLEVETPMMHPLVGGAAAKPFTTHHNAMDMNLFLRISPELYLKRLVVGGFERVYEINRNFRNEGLSARHNPEFTMLEFYQTYATYEHLMDTTEALLRYLANAVFGNLSIPYQDNVIDLSQPFTRMTLRDSILKFNPDVQAAQVDDFDQAAALARQWGIEVLPYYGLGKIQTELFEKGVEKKLYHPTFITQYPKEVSPLSRANDQNDFLTDRFEFFIGGQEIANGFSELNDPEDQAERFEEQLKAKAAGDLETMAFDNDYITALEYGLPPTAGEGIGIDRLVMFFTNSASIRDVILFPLMRPR